jgi:hypothetical protein
VSQAPCAIPTTPRSSPLLALKNIAIEPTRIYDVQDARQFLAGRGIDVDVIAAQGDGKFMSAFIRARKSARKAC